MVQMRKATWNPILVYRSAFDSFLKAGGLLPKFANLQTTGVSLTGKLYNPFVNLGLYVLLLILTPFIMLQNYLQTAVGMASRSTLSIGSHELPLIPILFLLAALILFALFRRELSAPRWIALALVGIHLALGQSLADYYFNHKFYDLQHNWHYIAYGIYAYLMYRALISRNLPPARIMLYTFLGALLISTADEAIQVVISTRIFDIGDIAKDSWGSLAGLIFIFIGIQRGAILKESRTIRHRHFRAYINSPLAVLCWAWCFNLILLCVGSLLTDTEYLFQATAISIGLFALLFLLVHATQWRIPRWSLIALAIIAVLIQGIVFLNHRDKEFVRSSPGWIVYRGIPLPYFDVLIHPNGHFRFVDKKQLFTKRDQDTLKRLGGDILLVGSGFRGRGGRGFPEDTEMQFIFNPHTHRGLQVIVLPTPQACDLYNQLRAGGKSVLLVVHNDA